MRARRAADPKMAPLWGVHESIPNARPVSQVKAFLGVERGAIHSPMLFQLHKDVASLWEAAISVLSVLGTYQDDRYQGPRKGYLDACGGEGHLISNLKYEAEMRRIVGRVELYDTVGA